MPTPKRTDPHGPRNVKPDLLLGCSIKLISCWKPRLQVTTHLRVPLSVGLSLVRVLQPNCRSPRTNLANRTSKWSRQLSMLKPHQTTRVQGDSRCRKATVARLFGWGSPPLHQTRAIGGTIPAIAADIRLLNSLHGSGSTILPIDFDDSNGEPGFHPGPGAHGAAEADLSGPGGPVRRNRAASLVGFWGYGGCPKYCNWDELSEICSPFWWLTFWYQ